MDIHSSLSFRLHTLVYTLDAIADRVITQSSSINFSQFLTLLCVYQNPNTTQKFVAGWLRVTEATVSYTIQKLSDAKLISVSKSMFDTRKNTVTLTPEGVTLVESLYAKLEESSKHLFSVLPKGRLAQLDTDVEKLVNTLNNKVS
ncbi:winged helix-turn-helix transcriptional regulator [Candidatus Saccharibacteria bacterium]|nr:winged helix-turn-helix transcriptional regulator [Candidatus Saccharibacteria bacterium]